MRHLRLFTFLFIVTTVFLAGCINLSNAEKDISDMSTEELIQLLEDPENLTGPKYYFGNVTRELATRGSEASDAAPALSIALTYPRRDSYLAGFALITLGENAKSAIPILVSELIHEYTPVRRYAALSLGAIGKPAECAVPHLASMLWHSEEQTRSAASIAIDAITGIDLVESEVKLDPNKPGVLAVDRPEGIVSEPVRKWWLGIGQYLEWPTENCEMQ